MKKRSSLRRFLELLLLLLLFLKFFFFPPRAEVLLEIFLPFSISNYEKGRNLYFLFLFDAFHSFFLCFFVQMEELRPEFRSGMDALAKYILQRARPKQLGSIVLTGPMFAALTQSFLDAINAGAVPTIATSWQVKKNTHTHSQSMYVCIYCCLLSLGFTSKY
jgi:hypothetical protein